MGRRTLVAVMAALALGGCGSDDPQHAERQPAAKTPTAAPSSTTGAEAPMPEKIVAAHTRVSEAYARWKRTVDGASNDKTVGETHRLVIVMRDVRDQVARDRGDNAKDERLRLDYVHASDAFTRAISAFADALESGSQTQLKRAVKQVKSTGPRYDAVVARATR